MNNVIIKEERLTKEKYIDFLKRTDLGSQYPKERFEERIEKLVKSVPICLVAKEVEKIVGVLFGLTDYSYWLFITDLGVDRSYLRKGIGRKLVKKALELAGGEKDIAIYLVANDEAIDFYKKIGMEKAEDVMSYCHNDWTEFTVK